MAQEVEMLARVRKVLEAIDADTIGESKQPTLTAQLELLMANGASPYGEIIRPGRAFYTNTTTPVAAVVAIPSTAHLVSIYNNYPDGGRCLIIDWVAAINAVATAVANQAGIIGNIGQVREAPPTDAALTIKKLNGYGAGGNDTGVRTILTGTALPATTGLAANWFPLGTNATKPGVAATPGYQIFTPIDGRIIVPPGRYFAMHVLASVVGETFNGFIAWHEKQLVLG
jgi:hypothetical protein